MLTKKVLLFVVILLLGFHFQNCAVDGFRADESASSLSSLETSPLKTREQELMLKLFGNQKLSLKSQSCQLVGQASLPLVTHYPSIGDIDSPELGNHRAASDFAAGLSDVPVYNINLFSLPSVKSYIANSFDLHSFASVSNENADRLSSLLSILCVGGLNQVRFIQGAHEIKAPGDLAKLVEENVPYFQILHSLVFKKNLFTVVIPPRWTRTSSAELPTVFNGFYELNYNFMYLEGQNLLETLAQAYKVKGQSGFGILWNGNGAIGSRTVNSQSYIELNEFLTIYKDDLGANTKKFITFGSSRGGITALNVASHPAVTAATVAFVFSSVPVNEINTVSTLVSPTIPLLFSASDWSVGFVGSWRKSFRHPSGFGRFGFEGLTGREAHIKVLTGTSDDKQISNEFNALAPSKVAKLIKNNTQIFVEVGSHDFIVPSTDQFRLFIDAIALGINMETRVNYLYGHSNFNELRQLKLAQVINTLIDQSPMESEFVKKGQVGRFVATPQGQFIELPTSNIPLSVEIPRYIIDESDSIILASGPINSRYLLVFRKGTEIIKVVLELDNKGLSNLRLPHDLFQSGDYLLSGVYLLNEQNRLTSKIIVTSLVKQGLLVSRIHGQIRQFIPDAGGVTIEGINAQGRYFNQGIGLGTNYGFLQKGTTEIPSEELALLEPPAISCNLSHSTRGPIAVGARITETLSCTNVPSGSRYRFSGTKNLVAFSDSLLPLSNQPIVNVFTNDGTTIAGNWVRYAEIINSSGAVIHKSNVLSVTLNRFEAAEFSCSVSNRSLASFSMAGTIKPSSSDATKSGYYFVAGYDVNNQEWWSFDGNQWAKHNGTNANYLPLLGSMARSLSVAGISQTLFTNDDLRPFPNGQIYLGYGTGNSPSVAWNDLISNMKYKLCVTLPSN